MSEVRQVVIGVPGDPSLAPEKDIPVLLLEMGIPAGATTVLADCAALNLSGVKSLMLTVSALYHAAATAGVRVHVRTAVIDDPWAYDTEDWDVWDLPLLAGDWRQVSHGYETSPRFIKVLIENLCPAQALPYADVIATIGV